LGQVQPVAFSATRMIEDYTTGFYPATEATVSPTA